MTPAETDRDGDDPASQQYSVQKLLHKLLHDSRPGMNWKAGPPVKWTSF